MARSGISTASPNTFCAFHVLRKSDHSPFKAEVDHSNNRLSELRGERDLRQQYQDGAIVALSGGFDFFASKYNRAVQAKRQPGSSFKPFIYSAALDKEFTPATIINDAPVVFEDVALEGTWRPKNYSGRFYGPTRMREAQVA